MIAGTLGHLEKTVEEPLESWADNNSLPALDVEKTQHTFDDRPIQSGLAAGSVVTTDQQVDLGVNMDGEFVAIDTENEERTTDVVTEWVADPTGTGLVAASSVPDPGNTFPFPFDLFMARTNQRVDQVRVDIAELQRRWTADGLVGDIWMVGSDDDGVRMDYHEAADEDDPATIGLGFERSWNGRVVRGVVYESGYCALYSIESAEEFVRFVADELLEHIERETGGAQQTLDEAADDGDGGSEVTICDECERESSTVQEYDGRRLCITCIDALESGGDD